MAVLVNFKICDNAKECGGISVCPTGALTYDEEKETIVIDNEKCISCGQCEKECPVGAIIVAKTKDEYRKQKEEIDNDSRSIKDLFVDRYGAAPLSEFFMIEENMIEEKAGSQKLVLVECYNDDSIQCLLKSIPIKDLTKEMPKEMLFYKALVSEKLLEKYDINELPALLVFSDGNLKGHIDGYFTNEEKCIFMEKINLILK